MLARLLSLWAALLGTLLLIHPRGSNTRGLFWLPKAHAEAFSFPAALAGILGAWVSLRRRRWKPAVLGAFGASVAARHLLRVSSPNRSFERAVGAAWCERMQHLPGDSYLRRRWSPLPAQPREVPWQPDFHVDQHRETNEPLLADLWTAPDGVEPSGLGIVFLHGSGWHYGDKDMRTRSLFCRFARQGHLVLDLAYTLAPKADLFEMVADVKRSIAWMKGAGTGHGVMPERVVLMGGSAGGHLALLAAYTPNHAELDPADVDADTSVRGVVSYYGIPDLAAQYWVFENEFQNYMGEGTRLESALFPWLARQTRRIGLLPPGSVLVTPASILPSLMGGTPSEVPERYRLGSPITHVNADCPPTLQVQGAHDFGGMAPQVRQLHQALRRAGVVSILLELPNTEHGFDLLSTRMSPSTQAAIYDTERFLAYLA